MREVDSLCCELCGLVVSATALAAGVGIRTKHGWIVADGAVMLPPCVDPDLDEELARLLADET